MGGAHSVYVDYERGCGEGCFEGEPTETQYLLAKVLPVACSFVMIAVMTVFARRASRCMTSLRCPCIASGVGTVISAQRTPRVPKLSLQLPKAASNISVKFGRPVIRALV